MATDWLLHLMLQPSGLTAIVVSVVLPFGLWWVLLGKEFARVGFGPLAVGYACAALGLLTYCFVASYIEFSSRVSRGLLSESHRWSIVPGWTIYTAVLYLVVVLPMIGMAGVPLSALMVRMRKLTYFSIAATTVLIWLSLAILAWSSPTNEWHRTHRAESFMVWLTDLLPGVVLVIGPFLLGIHGKCRRTRSERA